MSCQEETKRENLLEHLRQHINLMCETCVCALESEDGALPFGNAMMARFTCPKCQAEQLFVIQDDGQILTA